MRSKTTDSPSSSAGGQMLDVLLPKNEASSLRRVSNPATLRELPFTLNVSGLPLPILPYVRRVKR